MHTAAKVTLGIGGALLLIGVLVTIIGGTMMELPDEEAFDEKGASVWNGTSTTSVSLDLDSKKTYSVYVAGGREITSISVNGSEGIEQYSDYECEDSNPDDDWDECGEMGGSAWVWVGNIDYPDCPCTMDFNATGEVIVVDDDLYIEMTLDALGGIFGSLGAMSSGCCVGCLGVIALIIGLIMAISMKNVPATGMVVMQPGQTVGGQVHPSFAQPQAVQQPVVEQTSGTILPPIGGQLPPNQGF
jgi:hypothetical protein